MKLLGKVEQHVEVLAAAHAVTAGNDDGSTFQVVFRLFYVAVDNLHYIVRFGNVLGNVVTDYFTLVVGIQNLFLHHALAHGRHLRTVFGVHNRCHDVAAECGTDLVQQIFVGLALFLILMVADFE